MKIFSPLMRHLSPSRTAVVLMPAASLPAPTSVSAKLTALPSARPPRYFDFCSSVPARRIERTSTSARFFSPAPACLDHAPQGSRCRWTLPLHRSGAYSAPSRTLIPRLSSDCRGAFGRLFVQPLVHQHQSPDVVRKASFQATHRLVAGLVFSDLAVVVRAPDTVRYPHLGDRHQMQCGVELPVAAAREPVSGPITAGHLDGSDPGVVGKRRGAGEP